MPQIRRAPLQWYKKLLFSLVTTLVFLVIFEFGLQLAGVRSVMDTHDPFVGFSQQFPLFEVFEDTAGIKRFKTAANKLVWFNEQSFPKKKAVGTRRIFCLGGSTTYGHPYDDATSFSGWMREYLPLADADTKWEVINCGGISYASYRVASLMEELVQYEPDVFVVFSAHNEFLERRTYANMFEKSASGLRLQATLARTRTYALFDRMIHGNAVKPVSNSQAKENRDILPAEVDEILNHTIGPVDYHRDLAWRRKVVEHFELNLIRMVGLATKAGAKIVLVAPASNEGNCSPFKSEFSQDVTDAQKPQVFELLLQAESEVEGGKTEAAVKTLTTASELAPTFAETHYRLGKLLFQSDRFSEAQSEFIRALNEDICPLRAVDEILAAIRRVGDQFSVPVIDFERKLRELSQKELGHQCLGEEYFLDHVHPTIEVNRQLALWIIERMQEAKIVGGRDLSNADYEAYVMSTTEQVLDRIDDHAHGVALRNLAKVLHWSGKFAEAAPRASDAIELLPDDPESRFVLADCLSNIGDKDGALVQYELLFSGPKDWGRAYMPYAELLFERGEYARAKPFVMLGMLRDPTNAYIYFLLGKIHLELEEYELAVQSLKEANRLYPNEPATLGLLNDAIARIQIAITADVPQQNSN